MSNDPVDSLSDLAALKRLEQIDPDDTSQDAALRTDLSRATQLISRETNRLLLPSTGTKLFDAPYGALLLIPDATTVTTVHAWGATLTVDVDYRVIRGWDGLTVWGLQRLDAHGRADNWTPAVDPGTSPYGAISVVAAWGYTVAPADLVDLNQGLAVILFKDRNRLYAESEGGLGTLGGSHAVLHLVPEKLRTIFSLYWRPRIVQAVGL